MSSVQNEPVTRRTVTFRASALSAPPSVQTTPSTPGSPVSPPVEPGGARQAALSPPLPSQSFVTSPPRSPASRAPLAFGSPMGGLAEPQRSSYFGLSASGSSPRGSLGLNAMLTSPRSLGEEWADDSQIDDDAAHYPRISRLAALREDLPDRELGIDVGPIVEALHFVGGDDGACAEAALWLLDDVLDAMAGRGEGEPVLSQQALLTVIEALKHASPSSLWLAQVDVSLQGDPADAWHAQRRVIQAIDIATGVGEEVSTLLAGLWSPHISVQSNNSRSVSDRGELREVTRRLQELDHAKRLMLAACLERVVFGLSLRPAPLMGLIDLLRALCVVRHHHREPLIRALERFPFLSLRIAGPLMLALDSLPPSTWVDVWREARTHVQRVERSLGSGALRGLLIGTGLPLPTGIDADDERLAFVEVYVATRAERAYAPEHAQAAFELAQRYGGFGSLRENFQRFAASTPETLRREQVRIRHALRAAERAEDGSTLDSPGIWLGTEG